MYNIRYHIASLVSVFVALALGLVLGGLIVDATPQTSQAAIAESLKADFEALRKDNAETEALNKSLNLFANTLTSSTIQNQLTGYSVMVSGKKDKAQNEASRIIEDAGGRAVNMIVDGSKLDLTNTELLRIKSLNELAKAVKTSATQERDNSETTDVGVGADDEKLGIVTDALVLEWVDLKFKERPVTKQLIEMGVLEGIEDNARFGVVLGLVATNSATDTFARSLLRSFSHKGYASMGATLDGADETLALECWKDNVTGINTLGTSVGTYTITAVLKGADAGLYGTMKNATAPYAEMPSTVAYNGTTVDSDTE